MRRVVEFINQISRCPERQIIHLSWQFPRPLVPPREDMRGPFRQIAWMRSSAFWFVFVNFWFTPFFGRCSVFPVHTDSVNKELSLHVTAGEMQKSPGEPNLCHLLTRMWLEIRNNIGGQKERRWPKAGARERRESREGNAKIRWGWHFFWFPHTTLTWLLYILPFPRVVSLSVTVIGISLLLYCTTIIIPFFLVNPSPQYLKTKFNNKLLVFNICREIFTFQMSFELWK